MSTTYYSDNGVDRIIEMMLPDVGNACDVGASDGVFNSNTLMFEEKGWDVLCIEPNPLLTTLGIEWRKRWVEVACSSVDGEAQFESRGSFPYASGSSLGSRTGSPDGISFHQVKTRRLDSLLEEAGFTSLDLLCIDVEGWEPEVLEGFTIERWKPTIMVIEDLQDRHALPIAGYEHIEKRIFDNIYRRLA